MRTACQNIYKTCRRDAGINQETAADYLFVSCRSLADYEAGRTIPRDDIVCRMIETYNAPELAYIHLKLNNEVGKRYLPDLHLDELPTAVLRLQKESRHAQTREGDLIAIACDGLIDAEELPTWQKVRMELNDLAGAALAVLFTRKERRAVS